MHALDVAHDILLVFANIALSCCFTSLGQIMVTTIMITSNGYCYRWFSFCFVGCFSLISSVSLSQPSCHLISCPENKPMSLQTCCLLAVYRLAISAIFLFLLFLNILKWISFRQKRRWVLFVAGCNAFLASLVTFLLAVPQIDIPFKRLFLLLLLKNAILHYSHSWTNC